jgi:hypothetical protein
MVADHTEFNTTLGDFKLPQTHMTRREFTRNVRAHVMALIGVVACAVCIALAVPLRGAVPNVRAAYSFQAG